MIHSGTDATPEEIVREIVWQETARSIRTPWGLAEYALYLFLMPATAAVCLLGLCGAFGLFP